MLPYFGNTSSDEDDLDEDVPLSVKLSKNNKTNSLLSAAEKNDSSANEIELSTLEVTVSPGLKKRGRKPKKFVVKSLSPIKKPERKLTRSFVASIHDEGDSVSATIEDVVHNKTFTSFDSYVLSNVESPQLLRKSTRKLKTLIVTDNEKMEQVDNLNNDESTLNEKITENISGKCDKEIHVQDKPTPVRKRGRPCKLKPVIQEEIVQKSGTDGNDSFINEKEGSVQPEESETSNTENRDNTHITKRKGRNSSIHPENIPKEITSSETTIQPHNPISGEIFNETVIHSDKGSNDDVLSHKIVCSNITTSDGDSSSITETIKKTEKSSRLKLSDLNSAIEQSISLRKTRAKNIKTTLPKKCEKDINFSQQNDCENDIDNKGKLEISCEDLPLINRTLVNEELSIKRRGRKGKLSTTSSVIQYTSNDDSGSTVEDSNKVYDNDIHANNKEETESLIEPLINELPPSLVKTRARRPGMRTSGNIYLEPPSLETPFTSEVEVSEKEQLECLISTNPPLMCNDNVILPPKRRGRKPKKMLDSNIYQNNTGVESLDPPSETVKSLDELVNDKKLDTGISNKNEVPLILEEGQILTKKRGRRSKRKIIHKRTRQEFEFSNKEIDSEYDSEIEINFPAEKNNESTTGDNLEDISSFPSNEILPKIPTDEQNEVEPRCNQIANDNFAKFNEHTVFVLEDESKKRKRKLKETDEDVPATELGTNLHPLPEKNENLGNHEKKIKINDSEQTEEKRTSKTYSEPTSTNNFCETPASTSLNFINQTFLWNKISGFLNKTTRSVGTQVKVKNMSLKGFDTSEPEVSLQSELTLPQVIKTLFEELKSTDSSFSNP